MQSNVPERSLQQRLTALQEANRIRTKRADLKRDLKDRKESTPDLLAEPPQYIETMKVSDLVMATPKYGKVKTNKLLRSTRISASKTIGGLSSRQRNELAWRLNGTRH